MAGLFLAFDVGDRIDATTTTRSSAQ